MRKIFKYRLPSDGGVVVVEACVLRWLEIHDQDGWPHIWAIVDDEGRAQKWEIVAWGTGWDVPVEIMGMDYLGTAVDCMCYVWHYFVREMTPSYWTVQNDITTTNIPVEQRYTITTHVCS